MSSYDIISYATNWACYGRNYQIADIPIDNIRTLAYSFFNVDAQGNVLLTDSYADIEKRYTQNGVLPYDDWVTPPKPNQVYGNLGQIAKLKSQGKYFNLSMVLGGWTLSKHMSSAVRPENQNNFVKSICDMMNRFKTLDGQYTLFNNLTIDWEYLSSNGVNYGDGANTVSKDDCINYISFLKKLRPALNALRPKGQTPIKIGMCVSCVPEKVVFDIAAVAALVDRFDVMSYDCASYLWGNKKAVGHTNLYASPDQPWCGASAVDFFLSKGVAAKKLFLGVAFYSRGFVCKGVPKIGADAIADSPDTSWEAGITDFKTLPRPGATEYFDATTGANYSIDPVKKIINFYDSVQSVKAKCDYVKKKGIGGLIVWELSSDQPASSPRCLTKIMYNEFKNK